MDFSSITSAMTSLLGLAAAAIVGGLSVYGIFSTQKRTNETADRTVAQNLIDNYKTTVDEQDKKIKTSQEKEIEQGKQIAHLQGQVKILSELLQGRDPAMQAFLANADKLAVITEDNNRLAKETAKRVADLAEKNITELTSSIQMLVTLLTPKSAH